MKLKRVFKRILLLFFDRDNEDKFLKLMRKKKKLETVRYQFIYLRHGPCKGYVYIKDVLDGGICYLVKDIDELETLINTLDLPLRICTGCGSPMQEGFTDEYGDTYFCSQKEFKRNMDESYGIENWRAEPIGKLDHVYEYRENENSPWRPEPSFWTQWE